MTMLKLIVPSAAIVSRRVASYHTLKTWHSLKLQCRTIQPDRSPNISSSVGRQPRLSRAATQDSRHSQKETLPSEVHVALKQNQYAKRKSEGKPSLRRAALQAESSRLRSTDQEQTVEPNIQKKVVTAYCGAQQFDLNKVKHLLRDENTPIDPTGTSLYPQVIHIEMPVDHKPYPLSRSLGCDNKTGDVFIFPSGTVVAWDVSGRNIQYLVSKILSLTAHNSHALEDEDLEYVEDRTRERSTTKRGIIILGTKADEGELGCKIIDRAKDDSQMQESKHRHAKIVLAKIAFSSGLARSTKIAVLENLLDGYLEDTQQIPAMLMSGNLGALPRSFIYEKMGQLLNIRGQLNLSSDITDSLPDLLWDTEAELGLESYFDQMSRALDTIPRIESLNQKMDYAHEIAGILREELRLIHDQNQEMNSTRLEWIIVALIAVEVAFGCWHLYKEHRSRGIADVRIVE